MSKNYDAFVFSTLNQCLVLTVHIYALFSLVQGCWHG